MTVQLVYIKRRSTMTRDMIVGSFRLRKSCWTIVCAIIQGQGSAWRSKG